MNITHGQLTWAVDFISGKGEVPCKNTTDLMYQFIKLGGRFLVETPEQEAFLTSGGNLLRECGWGWYFCKSDGQFIRQVSDSEAEYLAQVCLKISLQQELPHPEFFPRWHFIKSVLVTQDNSNYKCDLSSNGGCYSFQTYYDWYVSRYPNGTYEFCFVERHTTSADFSYTELGGNFNSNPGTCYLLNVQGEVSYTMGCASHDEVLEKIATMSSFDHLWNSSLHFIPSEKGDECVYSALSFTDKKEIVSKLKHLFESQDSLEEYTWEEFRKQNAIARRRKKRNGGGRRNARR